MGSPLIQQVGGFSNPFKAQSTVNASPTLQTVAANFGAKNAGKDPVATNPALQNYALNFAGNKDTYTASNRTSTPQTPKDTPYAKQLLTMNGTNYSLT